MDLSVIYSFFASLGFLLTGSALRLCSRLPSVVVGGGGVVAAAVVVGGGGGGGGGAAAAAAVMFFRGTVWR